MTMTKRKGQTTDIKAPQKRSLRSRKREAAEEDDPLTEQREPIPVTETSTQDSDKINSTSQNASVSELTLQEHTGSSDSIGNIDSSKPELKETGDTITQCGGGAHLVSTKGSQSTHSANSAEPPSNQTKTSHQTSSLCAPEPSLDGEAVLGGHAPTVGEEKVGGEVVSESRHHHSQEHRGEATDVPGEERPWSSQGADGGHPTHAPARKKVRRRMGMGRLVEREKKNPLDGQNCVRRGGGHGGEKDRETDGGEGVEERETDGGGGEKERETDGGEKERETDGGGGEERETDGGEKERETDGGGGGERETDGGGEEKERETDGGGGEKERETDGGGGEKERETDGGGGVEVNDGPTVAEKEETVQPEITQSDAPLEESSNEMETEQSGGRGGKNTEQPETVAITTSDGSRTVLHSEKVTREEDPNSTGPPSKVASCEEQRNITPLQEIDPMELEVQQKHMGEDSSGEVKPSSSSSAIIKSTNKSTDVGEASPGNQIQDSAVTVATVAKHSIPDGLLKVEDARIVISDVLKSTEAIRTPECDVMSCSIKTMSSEPTVPSSGQEDSIRFVLEETPVPAKGHDPETHIIPDLSHDRDPFDPLSVTLVSDSQLNDITLIMEMEDQHGPESSRGHEDATELVCGLISELSSLNRTIMAAHRELDSLRRGNRNARTPQRRPYAPRRPDTQPPTMSLPGQ